MASAKYQLEELKKPNPRYVLELHTIRQMIQEARNRRSLKRLPQPPPRCMPKLSLPRNQPLHLCHALHTPHLYSQHTERSHPKHRRNLPRRHHRSRLPLLRLRKQRRLVFRLRLLRRPSPPKGRPLRSRSRRLVARPRRRPTTSKRQYLHTLLLPLLHLRHLGMRKAVGRGLVTMMPMLQHQVFLRHHPRRG